MPLPLPLLKSVPTAPTPLPLGQDPVCWAGILKFTARVPCGIFDDPKLVAELKEAVATITKATVQINELWAAQMNAQTFNQATRWVNTKEEHCAKIITAAAEYGLCQRCKTDGSVFKTEGDYIDAIKAHHAVMVAAMKCKQTVDVAACDKLEEAVGDFSKMYLPA